MKTVHLSIITLSGILLSIVGCGGKTATLPPVDFNNSVDVVPSVTIGTITATSCSASGAIFKASSRVPVTADPFNNLSCSALVSNGDFDDRVCIGDPMLVPAGQTVNMDINCIGGTTFNGDSLGYVSVICINTLTGLGAAAYTLSDALWSCP